ncbi:two-partner secretion domain-containing protein [Nostoc sp.]|uniref:two-partner secretion domain-containing protein n=1 Tax=Nostoc sp. TaxID=1180 RepID=UPI002FF8BE7A
MTQPKRPITTITIQTNLDSTIAVSVGMGIAIAFWANCAFAQITPDATLRNNSTVKLEGNTRIIEGGTREGDNLFHSFMEFSVHTGSEAYFKNTLDIQNIISRVTGKSVSNIDGLIRTSGTANLFLINPNGIIFGKDAQLNVGGSFVATTANAIGFGNQGFFSATNPNTPALLTVNPSALLFNQIATTSIQNNSVSPAGVDPSGFDTFGLRVPDGQSLLLVGGDISMNGGKLNAFGGQVELGGLAAGGKVRLNGNDNNLSLTFPDGVERADVVLRNGSAIDTSAADGGSIKIDAQNIRLIERSNLFAGIRTGLGTLTSQAGDITLNAAETIRIEGGRVVNNVYPSAIGNSGNILITTGFLSLMDGAKLDSGIRGRGRAGNIIINARDAVSIDRRGGVFSSIAPGAEGEGGDVKIFTGSLLLTNGAQLGTSTLSQGRGRAGNIIINARDTVSFDGVGSTGFSSGVFSAINPDAEGEGGDVSITADVISVTNGAQLSSSTFGRGSAGDVIINARDTISFDGVGSNRLPSAAGGAVAPGAEGAGGDVRINTRSISVTNGAKLDASTFGRGSAGNVIINARDTVSLDGLSSDDFSSIRSIVAENAIGKSGDIRITTGWLSVTNGAQINNTTYGEGNAGSVIVEARDRVSFDSGSNLYTGVWSNAEGKGGDIHIATGSLSVTNGSQLDASTFGRGSAGNIIIKARDLVSLDGVSRDGVFESSIFATVESDAEGKGGDIRINTGSLSVTNGAQLATDTLGQGNAGSILIQARDAVSFDGVGGNEGNSSAAFTTVGANARGKGGDIRINAGSLSVTNGGQLLTRTLGQGNAGNIEVSASNSVSISGASSVSGRASAFLTFTESAKSAGDIIVDSRNLHVSDGAFLDARTRSSGNGGSIKVKVNSLEAINGGQILTTTSSSGQAGKIVINATERVVVSGNDSTFFDRITQFPQSVETLGSTSGFFVRSQGSGSAGDIEVNARSIDLDNQGKFIAESFSGDGGNINLTVQDLLLLRRNSQISTNAGTEKLGGNGGNININSRFIVADPKENSDISANAFTGIGGRVDITSDGLFGIVPQKSPTEKSDITASSQLGVSGTVTINTPDVDPSRGLTQLPSNVVDASQQIAQGCTPRRGQNAGRFIATGRGGLPQSPNEPLRGRAVITGWVDLPPQATERVTDKISTTSVTKSTNQIVEAQGWIVDAKGDIILVAQSGQSSSIPSAISCNQ